MNKMIQVATGFQYSVNIGYDLNHDDKLRNFIPTKSSLQLLKEILLSTKPTSTERARILIGAYGKGKSHIVLTILSILMQRQRSLFVHLMPKIEEDPELKQLVDNYYSDPQNKIFPVIINGSNTSLPQAFLLALQRALSENNLDIMPETNYKAAVKTIQKWEKDYPEVYKKFKKNISMPVSRFISEMEDYNIKVYEEFEQIYPTLTAGSLFNPFIGFDVVDLYESVSKSLKERGYLGIYVVYDEFSKFLEANITTATVSDTKMLQDFAEKCNRSGNTQMHLLLISHKEISNYIDQLQKQKVDGWRGVSDRFKHIHLNNNFSQTYDIISNVIIKDPDEWKGFCNNYTNKSKFKKLEERYKKHAIFSDSIKNEFEITIYGCYPLHPVSTFILPRLSERIAQNERTLFTFLSAEGHSTLTSFLKKEEDQTFKLLTPDVIFDYFYPVFQKEPLYGEMHKTFSLTVNILEQIKNQELESKIIKTISLIYILEQFDKLKPVKEELVGIYELDYSTEKINKAIEHLVKDEYVIYLKQSNGYLKLKQSSGIDVEQRISDTVASMKSRFSLKEVLNSANIDSYLYPSRYNDEKEMTRYFEFRFVQEKEFEGEIDWNIKSETIQADGVIYGVLPQNNESLSVIKKKIIESSRGAKRCIFIVPKKVIPITKTLEEFEAVKALRGTAKGDTALFEDYEVIYEDLQEVINSFISGYTHPEEYKSIYIYNGQERNILRKAELTGLASEICDQVFSDTPIINNEVINKNVITSIANNSRNKIIAGLLRNKIEPNLGLTGNGQEVSIMRSTLLRKDILVNDETGTRINLSPVDDKMKEVLNLIASFITDAKTNGHASFAKLYDKLILPKYHIGLRKGVIPIYIASVFHEFQEDIIIQNELGQLPLTADTLQAINAAPEEYTLEYLDWNPEKQHFVTEIAKIFRQYVIDAERKLSTYEFAAAAMKRWYLSLPKFSKETKVINGTKIDSRYLKMVKLLKQNLSSQELLFEKLPEAFGYMEFNAGLAENIQKAKEFYDNIISSLKYHLINEAKHIFSLTANREDLRKMSFASVVKDWCESLDQHVFEQLFENGTDKCLELFKSVTNDEVNFISRLAKLATGLRVEDWGDETEKKFSDVLKIYRKTAESFHTEEKTDIVEDTNTYEIRFRSENGTAEVKRFNRVETSRRGKLLYNSILSEIDSMGHSISDQEKRQILMDILRKIC